MFPVVLCAVAFSLGVMTAISFVGLYTRMSQKPQELANQYLPRR